MNEIGTRLRTLREARSWTQAELAERAGAHQAYIANIENGRKTPSIEMLLKIANALGVTPSDLLADPTPA